MISEKYNAATLIDANLEAGRGEKTAIHFGDERITYQDLFDRVRDQAVAVDNSGAARFFILGGFRSVDRNCVLLRIEPGLALCHHVGYLGRREQRLELVAQRGAQLFPETRLVLRRRTLGIRHLLVGHQRCHELWIVQVDALGEQLLAGARRRLAQSRQRP